MKFVLSVSLLLATLSGYAQLKWQQVESVYTNLVNAVGDGSKIAPPIELSRTESRVAYYAPSKQTIFIEERFLQICQSFGPDSLNALAFILGHELAHFYRNHGWVHAQGMGYVTTELKADWKALSRDENNHAKDEAEADIFSGFYALVAGYQAMDKAGETLRKVYKAYGISDTIPGYPTLSERVEIAQNARQKASDLYVLFQVGIYCLATEKFEVATKLFTNIYNSDYSGTEILNNLAVAEIMWGYTLYGEEPAYYYPVFITTETALDPNSRAGGEGETHIRKGIAYLKSALGKSQKNPTFLLNLASAFAMLNEFTDAEYYMAKATENGCHPSAIANLKGIIAAKKGETKLAKTNWKSALKLDNMAELNYGIAFKNQTFGSTSTSTKTPAAIPAIDEVNLDDPALKQGRQFTSIKMPGLRISYAKLPNSTLYEVYGGSSVQYLFQSFNTGLAANVATNYAVLLQGASGNVLGSSNHQLLKLEQKGAALPTYVKYRF